MPDDTKPVQAIIELPFKDFAAVVDWLSNIPINDLSTKEVRGVHQLYLQMRQALESK